MFSDFATRRRPPTKKRRAKVFVKNFNTATRFLAGAASLRNEDHCEYEVHTSPPLILYLSSEPN